MFQTNFTGDFNLKSFRKFFRLESSVNMQGVVKIFRNGFTLKSVVKTIRKFLG